MSKTFNYGCSSMINLNGLRIYRLSLIKFFYLFFLISKDLDKVTALRMSYGLNLSFRSPESIGEYSEKNLAP